MDSIKKCVGMNTYNEYMSIKVDSLRESKNMFKYRNKLCPVIYTSAPSKM